MTAVSPGHNDDCIDDDDHYIGADDDDYIDDDDDNYIGDGGDHAGAVDDEGGVCIGCMTIGFITRALFDN